MRYLLFLLVLSACSATPDSPEKQAPGTITLIFEALPDYPYRFPEGVAQYVDDHFIKQPVRPDPLGDTLTIHTARDLLGLMHMFPFQEKEGGSTTHMRLNYAFQKGDTVRFSYTAFAPHVEVLNRDVNPYDLNYDLAAWEQLYERNAPERAFMFSFVFDPDLTPEERDESFYRHMEMVHAQDLDEVEREDAFLDSLFDAGLISEFAFEYHKAINYFEVIDRDIRRERVDRYVSQDPTSGLSEQERGAIPELSYDALAAFGIIQFSLSDYTAARFQIPTVSENYDGSGMRYPDYPLKFDSTLQADWLPQKAKEVLLFDDLQGIMREYPVEYRFRYLSKFKEFATDPEMVNYITEQYGLEAGEEDEMLLEDLDGKIHTFSEVLAEHRGKVVYVDWWATWCGPCIAVMPEMQTLVDSLAGKDVEVLFISMDERKASWTASVDSLLPGIQQNSYRVANKYISKELEDFNIQFIPRYFLIDQKGKIVEEYAPGPDEEQLKVVLAELLD